ncbi:MAG: penicillin-binding protein activator [Fibromonadaceae bacterium]|jgi:ABC-type branched-subunit amino acid transport system substrate-binding protein|nr:penicillin-binding protein activator [Fibromonadaceae bacterium]
MRLILLLLFFALPVLAVPSYNDALKKIQAGDFAGAKPILEAMVKTRWKAGEQEKAVVLYIETCIRLGNLNEARRYSSQFLDFFSKSKYRDRVEMADAISNILSKDAYSGAETLRRVLAYTKNSVSSARSRDLLIHILAAEILSADELRSLLEKGIQENRARGVAQMGLGKHLQKEKRNKAAIYWYNEAKKSNPNLTERLDNLVNELAGKGAGVPVILVLAPLSGSQSELGNYMTQGVLLYADSLKNRAKIQIVNGRADPATSLRRVKQAIVEDSVIAVIGPLLSASAATVAAWMSERAPNIPLITPTATDDGIADIGKNIFQLNVSSAKLASSMADYAMDCLDISEFAIMAPYGDYGSIMTDEFQRAVERRGGVISIVHNYAEGQPDYQGDFKRFRDNKLTLDMRRRSVGQGKGDNSQTARRDSWLADSTFIMPAIFIPSTTPAQAGLMASQVAFHKLRVNNLLGTSGWHGREFLLNAKNQAEGSAYSVAFYSGQDNSIKAFNDAFKSKWQTDADENKIAGLSYDAIRIIAKALSAEPQAESLPAAILRKKEYDGVYGKIRFTEAGANENVGIMSVVKGALVEKSPTCKTGM